MARKTIISIILTFCCMYNLHAENGISVKLIKSNSTSEDIVAPQFSGGEQELYNFLQNNIVYPALLIQIRMEGEIDLKFTIDKEGAVKKIEINKGFDPIADEEVMKAVRSMPKWSSATQDGKAIDMEQRMIVTFTLNDELIERAKQKTEANKSKTDTLPQPTNGEKNNVGELNESPAETVSHVDTLLNRVPQFPGGQEALDAYLKANLKYPKRALQMKAEGRVIFNLVISAEGEISKIMLFKGVYRDCDEEGIYLIRKMPKWIPGLKDGKPEAMQVMLAIPFVLPE